MKQLVDSAFNELILPKNSELNAEITDENHK